MPTILSSVNNDIFIFSFPELCFLFVSKLILIARNSLLSNGSSKSRFPFALLILMDTNIVFKWSVRYCPDFIKAFLVKERMLTKLCKKVLFSSEFTTIKIQK